MSFVFTKKKFNGLVEYNSIKVKFTVKFNFIGFYSLDITYLCYGLLLLSLRCLINHIRE